MKGIEDLADICSQWQEDINVHLRNLRAERTNLDTALLQDPDEKWRYD
jgi:hypothetical protein